MPYRAFISKGQSWAPYQQRDVGSDLDSVPVGLLPAGTFLLQIVGTGSYGASHHHEQTLKLGRDCSTRVNPCLVLLVVIRLALGSLHLNIVLL